jgi:hypothetical protein
MNLTNIVLALPVLAFGSLAQPTLSVCDAIAQHNQLNHKSVVIRGVQVATDEGTWLEGRGCSENLATSGYFWPTTIWLELSEQYRRRLGWDSTLADTSIARINSQLKKNGFDRTKEELVLTYVGLFETYDNFEDHVFRDSAGAHGRGFGHLNSSPAMLVVKDVRDPAIKKKAR